MNVWRIFGHVYWYLSSYDNSLVLSTSDEACIFIFQAGMTWDQLKYSFSYE